MTLYKSKRFKRKYSYSSRGKYSRFKYNTRKRYSNYTQNTSSRGYFQQGNTKYQRSRKIVNDKLYLTSYMYLKRRLGSIKQMYTLFNKQLNSKEKQIAKNFYSRADSVVLFRSQSKSMMKRYSYGIQLSNSYRVIVYKGKARQCSCPSFRLNQIRNTYSRRRMNVTDSSCKHMLACNMLLKNRSIMPYDSLKSSVRTALAVKKDYSHRDAWSKSSYHRDEDNPSGKTKRITFTAAGGFFHDPISNLL